MCIDDVDGEHKDAQRAVCVVMRGIMADGSAENYSWSNCVFIEWLMSLESCLDVFETWFLLVVEEINDRKQRIYTKKLLLSMDPHKDNCPLIWDKMTFEVFSHYLVTKKRKEEEAGQFKPMIGVAVH